MLCDIRTGRWDEDICALLDIPQAMLPEVRDCADEFGVTEPAHFGVAVPIRGVAGDRRGRPWGKRVSGPA